LPIAARHEKVRSVQIVLVSSPGTGGAPHWSHELASDFARLAVARGATVRWLAGLHQGQPVPPGSPGVQVFAHQDRRELPWSKVAASQLDVPLEVALTACLREEPLSVVVHVGVGTQGTPNVLWLSDRLGSRTFACLRGIELVCHRGDLLDRDQRICSDWSDPERCRWCCSTSWFRRPSSNDLRNRVDLLIAGLQTCNSISVPEEDDVAFVKELGIAGKLIAVGATAEELVARVFAAADPVR
tara:strand:+ start:9376 stop:10101 length:726 start_codon:yes stop_codon:yes gene_type:complete